MNFVYFVAILIASCLANAEILKDDHRRVRPNYTGLLPSVPSVQQSLPYNTIRVPDFSNYLQSLHQVPYVPQIPGLGSLPLPNVYNFVYPIPQVPSIPEIPSIGAPCLPNFNNLNKIPISQVPSVGLPNLSNIISTLPTITQIPQSQPFASILSGIYNSRP